MINPTSITKFDRTTRELQIFWLFCIMVAGKNSDQVAAKLGKLIQSCCEFELPFDFFRNNMHAVHNVLVANKIGQYNRIEKAIAQSVDLDLENATLDNLMNVFGVGPKTARFFLLHTRRDCDCAVLDTHVLKWLGLRGVIVPTATPQNGIQYEHLERLFLLHVKAAFPTLSVAEADLLIWSQMSGRLGD